MRLAHEQFRRLYNVGNVGHWLLFGVMIALKLKGILLWPWWRVTMPIWGALALLFVLVWWGGPE